MEDDEYNQAEQPSKTSLKKQMHALQEMGARLVGFSESLLDQLPLSDRLRAAIREFRRLPNSHGARRRQMQYIGRLMRDQDLADLERRIELLLQPRSPSREDPELAAIRRQILQQGDRAIEAVLRQYSTLDRQVLRHAYLEYQRLITTDGTPRTGPVEQRLTDYLKVNLQREE